MIKKVGVRRFNEAGNDKFTTLVRVKDPTIITQVDTILSDDSLTEPLLTPSGAPIEIEVVYHIGSYSDSSLAKQLLVLATRAQREENPIPGKDATKLPTLRDIFYSVEFHEREVFEMFVVYFTGHPDNRRLLLPEDWADLPPLRKDFAIKGR